MGFKKKSIADQDFVVGKIFEMMKESEKKENLLPSGRNELVTNVEVCGVCGKSLNGIEFVRTILGLCRSSWK